MMHYAVSAKYAIYAFRSL